MMIKVSHLLSAMLWIIPATGALAQQTSTITQGTSQSNKAIVNRSFQQWQDSEGSPFDLLSEGMRWTIAGFNRYAGTYELEPFIKDLVEPFTKHLKEPLKPTRWDVYEDGNVVIIHFDAEAPLISGELYSNSYAWFFTFSEGKVTKVTAFLDMTAFEAVMDSE